MKLCRKKAFSSLITDCWYEKLMKKLTKSDLSFIEFIIEENKNLSKDEYEIKVTRLFMDDKNPPKNWKIIKELLIVSNR